MESASGEIYRPYARGGETLVAARCQSGEPMFEARFVGENELAEFPLLLLQEPR